MSAVDPSDLACPRDGAQLVEIERSGVTIDACPMCRGIWLDRGELEKLIEEERTIGADDDFLDEVTGHHSTVDRANDRRGHESRDGGRKGMRRGLLENFLDFGGD